MGDLASNVIEGLERLVVSQGRHAGKALTILPWQRRLIRGVLREPVAAVSVARGNGKTTLCAGLAIAALVGPLRQPRGEVIAVASSFAQARILFEHVREFLRPALDRQSERFRVLDSNAAALIEDRDTGCKLRCIASDPRRAHGLAPVMVLADEPAQWPHTTSERMLAALRTASGKVEGSRFIALGTRPADGEHWFAKMLDGGAGYAQTHAAGPDDPPFQRKTWRRANPSIDHMPDLAVAIRAEAQESRRDPAMLAAFRALRLNLGVEDVETALLLSADTWKRIEIQDMPLPEGGYALGLDLGDGAAMSAAAAYWPGSGGLEAVAAFPSVPSLAERSLADGVGRLYGDMAGRNELIVTPGRAVDVEALLQEALRRWGRPAVIVADRYRETDLRQALDRAGFPQTVFETRGQGFRDGAEDVRQFRRACLEGKVAPARSLLIRAALAEARTVSDPSGNEKLAKGTQGGRRRRARDDAAAACILAVAAGVRRGGRSQPTWRYRGLIG